jgi:hypothetical protein
MNTKRLDVFKGELEEVENVMTRAVQRLAEAKPKHTLLAHQAEWHIRGLLYHFRRCCDLYEAVAAEVGSRVLATNASIIVMHSPDMQALIFEFYALIILARITLDESIKYVRPLFVNRGNLPKSVNDFLKGESDCPLHDLLKDEPVLGYLVDLRDCIVHYRTFATSDNTVAVADDLDDSSLPEISSVWPRPVTRTYFRSVGGAGVAVNVVLPDAIFVYDESGRKGKMVQSFSYNNSYNLLTQSGEFIKLCTAGVAMALELLARNDSQIYTWQK